MHYGKPSRPGGADDKDIDVLLKPSGYADYTISFAQGALRNLVTAVHRER